MRYFTLGAPPGRRGTAFLPGMPITAKALKWGLWGSPERLVGQPGTQAIPVPRPSTSPAAGARVSPVNGIFSSLDAPQVIYPSLYYVHGPQEHAPVSLLRTNNMPVPAGDVFKGPSSQVGGTQTSRVSQVAARTSRVGGRAQTGWPATVTQWPWGNQASG